MQGLLPFEDTIATPAVLHGRLIARYGVPGPWHHLDPVSQLVMGLIGGRTHSDVSLACFEALRQRFASWEDVRDAPPRDIQACIARVTFAEAKAPRLKAALQRVTALRGRLELDFLADWPVEPALVWLERLPGVGRKVSAATLNFSSLRHKALVLDSHHLRVLKRLGLIRPRADAEEAYRRIVPRLPPDWTAKDFDDHHQLFKTLGQRRCHHAAPACPGCPLRALCPIGNRPAGRGAAPPLPPQPAPRANRPRPTPSRTTRDRRMTKPPGPSEPA